MYHSIRSSDIPRAPGINSLRVSTDGQLGTSFLGVCYDKYPRIYSGIGNAFFATHAAFRSSFPSLLLPSHPVVSSWVQSRDVLEDSCYKGYHNPHSAQCMQIFARLRSFSRIQLRIWKLAYLRGYCSPEATVLISLRIVEDSGEVGHKAIASRSLRSGVSKFMM